LWLEELSEKLLGDLGGIASAANRRSNLEPMGFS